MNKLLITDLTLGETPCMVTALIVENKMIELQITEQEKKGLLGNIYVGRVQNIVKNINAAFIEIQDGIVCYYSLDEHKGSLRIGDELLVQVNREDMKTKAPSVTSNLSFTGKYLVLTSGNRKLGISNKLKPDDKAKLRKWLEPELESDFGLIARTNANDASKQEILLELVELKKRWKHIQEIGGTRTCFSLLEAAYPSYLLALRDVYGPNLDEILTDSPVLYAEISNYLKEYQPSDDGKLRLYQDKLLPLRKLYSIETVLAESQKEKVWLKSGGFLVIQPTEAFVSIDVNTGKFIGKKKVQETFRKINLEAAEEIAYQLRLRNLSGIILVDFINMERVEHQEELLHVFQNFLRKDPMKTVVVDMTKLNIVEVTRKKLRKSLSEELASMKK